MAVYDYVAIGADGKRATGVITADSARSARKELRLRQLSPLDVKGSPAEIGQQKPAVAAACPAMTWS